MRIDSVLVVGSGLMGGGIAQVCAQAGLHVTLNDVSEAALARARKTIAWSVNKLVGKGKLQEAAESIMDRIRTATDLDGVDRVDLAIIARPLAARKGARFDFHRGKVYPAKYFVDLVSAALLASDGALPFGRILVYPQPAMSPADRW